MRRRVHSGEGRLRLTLRVRPRAGPADAENGSLFDRWRSRIPAALDGARARRLDERMVITVPLPDAEDARQVWFFPHADGVVAHAGEQEHRVTATGSVAVTVEAGAVDGDRLNGVVAVTTDAGTRGFRIRCTDRRRTEPWLTACRRGQTPRPISRRWPRRVSRGLQRQLAALLRTDRARLITALYRLDVDEAQARRWLAAAARDRGRHRSGGRTGRADRPPAGRQAAHDGGPSLSRSSRRRADGLLRPSGQAAVQLRDRRHLRQPQRRRARVSGALCHAASRRREYRHRHQRRRADLSARRHGRGAIRLRRPEHPARPAGQPGARPQPLLHHRFPHCCTTPSPSWSSSRKVPRRSRTTATSPTPRPSARAG